jgi:nucleoside phosphorylase
VDGLVSWGSAAALVPELAPGDLLLPQAVITADDRRYAIDPDWRVALAGMIGQCVHLRDGALVESRHVINEIAAKQRLHTASGAHACDMESAAVAAVAAEFRLPFIAIRAIVDDATMILPPSARAAVDADGALQPLALLCSLAGRPSAVHAQLRALKQLAVAFRAAQLTLAAVAPILREE